MKERILASLAAVDRERTRRDADPALQRRVLLLKRWQQLRFERSYADLLASPRYREAALFFLNDLYGPTDFRRRDQQFARIVPSIVRLFPSEVVVTVADLGELHAVSETLDSRMAAFVPDGPLERADYVRAWNRVGRRDARDRQVELVLAIGEALDRIVRHAWIVRTLMLMRGPARAAGMESLQQFLEAGMSAFRGMGGARWFLDTVGERERVLIDALFGAAAAGDLELPQLPERVD